MHLVQLILANATVAVANMIRRAKAGQAFLNAQFPGRRFISSLLIP
jgi:hypothetical protein